MKYKLTHSNWYIKNILYAYPTDFKLDREYDLEIGTLTLPDKEQRLLQKANYADDDRYETIMPMTLLGKVPEIKNISHSIDKSLKDIFSKLKSNPKLSSIILNDLLSPGELSKLILEVTNKARKMDVNLYLALSNNRFKTQIYALPVGEEFSSSMINDYETRTESSFELVGKAEGVPRLVFNTMERHVCDSSVSRNYRECSPEILFPTHSLFNHFRYKLGRYDQEKKEEVTPVENQKTEPVNSNPESEDHPPF
jgi:hypothetical protein